MRHSARRSGSRRCSHEKNADAEEFPNIRPPYRGRIKLRILGTAISLLEELRLGAERDLGMDIEFDNQDFMTAQHKAALEPMACDIYDQCFHNLDIVWHWRAVQPIDIERITLWNEITDLTKTGRIGPNARIGQGDLRICLLRCMHQVTWRDGHTDATSGDATDLSAGAGW